MIIKSVQVRNFRSTLDVSVPCSELTALVGANGSGKSAFLRAIQLFYAGSPQVSPEDFYNEDTSRDIEVEITFTDLGKKESELFAAYVENGDLTVVRVLSLSNGRVSTKYHGSRLQNPEFAEVRAQGTATELRKAYNALRGQDRYSELPSVGSQADALLAMDEWEAAHSDACERIRDDGQFFGFTQVAQGYLGRFTRFIHVPAVRDAAQDAEEGRGSAITEIMDLVVRSALADREDLKKLGEDVQARYDEIMDPSKVEELSSLEERLSNTLRTYVPDAAVALNWQKESEIKLPLPRALVRLVEDGYPASVIRTGHGLQRAFILTMLQHLAMTQLAEQDQGPSSDEAKESTESPAVPAVLNLVLGIEEPELYQHPARQRHLARILASLAHGQVPGVAEKTQVIYATHSPLFVGIDRVERVRLFRKIEHEPDKPKVTQVVEANLDEAAEELWEANGKPGPKWTGATLRPRLRAIMTPWMNEGFFADAVVLVEGEDDRAAVLAMAQHMDHDLEAEGISVIPCMGKCNLDRPYLIFTGLGIPTFVLWDSDKDGKDADRTRNWYLLRLLGQKEEDWPNQVHREFGCFEQDAGTCLRQEIGPALFDKLLTDTQESLGMAKKKDALKNPMVLETVIKLAAAMGGSSETLETIVDNVLALKQGRSGRS
jgi:hypothetical protein